MLKFPQTLGCNFQLTYAEATKFGKFLVHKTEQFLGLNVGV